MKPAARIGTVALTCVGILLMMSSDADARFKRREHDSYKPAYTQRGFQLYAGIGGQGYEINDKDYAYLEERDSEGLGFIGAAIGLDRDLALYLELAASEHDTPIGNVDFGYLHLGLKYAFNTGSGSPWQPYGKASFGAMFMDEKFNDYYWDYDDDNGYFGPSLGLGVGVDRFISRRAAVFGELGFLFGRFDHRVIDGHEYNLADEIGVSSGRVQFGFRLRL